MQRLVPDVQDLDVDEVYADLLLPAPGPGQGRASVALGMVASVDGAVALEGTSGGLGGDADGRAFRRLRDGCDAILVGAGTARAERYGPPRAPAERVARRRAAGLAPAPQLIVVTASADLDPTARLFAAERDAQVPPPLVVTCAAAPADRVAALEEVTDVLRFGDATVDLGAALRWCSDRGLPRVLCEGGPALNGALLTAGLVDEIFLTVAPLVVGSDAGRIVDGPALGPQRLELVELHEHAGELLLRYRVGTGRPAD